LVLEHYGLTVHFDHFDVTHVEGKFTELADREHFTDFVFGDGEGSRVDRFAETSFEDNFRLEQAKDLNAVVGAVNVHAVANVGVLTFFGIIFVLSAVFGSFDGFVKGSHDFVSGFEFNARESRNEEFEFQLALFKEVAVFTAENYGITSSFREFAFFGRFIRVGERSEGCAEVCECFDDVHTVIDIRSVVLFD